MGLFRSVGHNLFVNLTFSKRFMMIVILKIEASISGNLHDYYCFEVNINQLIVQPL